MQEFGLMVCPAIGLPNEVSYLASDIENSVCERRCVRTELSYGFREAPDLLLDALPAPHGDRYVATRGTLTLLK